MIRIFISLIILLTGLNACAQKNPKEVLPPAKDGYKIEVKMKGMEPNTMVMLTFAMGEKDKFFVRDTAYFDNKGVAVFSKNDNLERGLYMVYFPDLGNYFEIMITNHNFFSVEVADKQNLYKGLKVSGSIENQKFFEYQNYLADKTKEQAKEVSDYRENFIKDYPDHLLSSILKMMKDIEVPDAPANLSDDEKRTWQYNYYKIHYWDNVNFAESGLVRSPGGVLHMLLERYFDKVLNQDPDSLVKYVDIVIDNAINAGNSPMAKYFIQTLSRKYETSKVMCHDGVFAHIGKRFYCPDRKGKSYADWVDSATMMKICEKAHKISFTACKAKVLDLRTADINDKYHHLYDLKAPFTVVFFWDPTCGHCKKVIPKLNDISKRLKDTVAIYAIGTESKYDEWAKYIKANPEISHWTNVSKSDPNIPWVNNRYYYNIQANPTIILLDEDKKVIAKKIDENKLEEFMVYMMGEKGLISSEETNARIRVLQAKEAAEKEKGDGENHDTED
jgi:thiol-disulfide isomerase/thioredoxin